MPLEIFLLGQFKMTFDSQTLDLPSRPAQSLLAYLAMNAGSALRREKLASLLWPDSIESNARAYLRQALWRIRKCFDSTSLRWEDYIQIGEIDITFQDRPDVWVDAELILRPTAGLTLEEVIDQLKLYRGEFLPGFYEEWVGLERDRLQAAYQQKMEDLLNNLLTQKRWQDVLYWCEESIRLGPPVESVFQAMMKAHAGLGSQGMVRMTYQRCKEALEHDLGVDVSPQTEHLYAELKRGHRSDDQQPSRKATPSTLQPSFLSEHPASHVEASPVVAREQELQQLESALNLAMLCQGQVIFVTGEAGSGKTTLVTEFARRARAIHNNLVFASGSCNAHTGIGDPYLPFREILEQVTGDVEARWRAGAITKEEALLLWNLIPVTTQALVDNSPGLLDTFVSSSALYERASTFDPSTAGWKDRLQRYLENGSGASISRSTHQTDLFVQYNRLLQTIARKAALVLFVDDLQWADMGSISLLFHLGRHLSGSRLLVVGAYRPEEVALGFNGERHPLEQVVNELQRTSGKSVINLDQTEGRQYVNALLDSEPHQLSVQFREMLFLQTRGHPLFTIELLRGMQARGDIVKQEGSWIEGPNLNWESLPARVEAVIAERIGRLTSALQSLLRVASVEGELFTAEVLAQVLNRPTADILHDLSSELDRKHRLVRAQSIQRVGGQLLSGYRFRHFLVQKYVYGSLDEVERVHLHEQIGCTLETMVDLKAGTSPISYQLARHFEESRNTGKAVYYLLQSGARALLVSAYQDAVLNLKKGLALIACMSDSTEMEGFELSLLLELSTALHLSKGMVDAEAEKTALRAYHLCQKNGNSKQMGQILGALSLYAYVQGEYRAAMDYAEKLLRIGEDTGDLLMSACGHWCMGLSLFGSGAYLESRCHLDQVVSFYDPIQHHQPFVLFRGVDVGLSAMAYLASCLWCLGYPEQAVAVSAKTLDLAKEIGHAFTLADVLRYGCCELHFYRRDAQALQAHAEAMIHLSEEKKFPAWLATGNYCLGEAYLLMDRRPEGIALLQEGVQAELSAGVRISVPAALCFLAEMYANLGEVAQGLNVWNESFRLLEQTGERHWEAEHYRVLALLQQAQGSLPDAEASLMKAIETARHQNARSWELRAAVSLARLWQQQHRMLEGQQLVQDVLARFTEGFDTPELQEAMMLAGTPNSSAK